MSTVSDRKIRHIEVESGDESTLDKKQAGYVKTVGDWVYKDAEDVINTYTKKGGDAEYATLTSPKILSNNGNDNISINDDGTIVLSNCSIGDIEAGVQQTVPTREWTKQWVSDNSGNMIESKDTGVGFEDISTIVVSVENSGTGTKIENTDKIKIYLKFNADQNVRFPDGTFIPFTPSEISTEITSADFQNYDNTVEDGMIIVYLAKDGTLIKSQDWLSLPSVAITFAAGTFSQSSVNIEGYPLVYEDIHYYAQPSSVKSYLNTLGSWVEWGLDIIDDESTSLFIDEGTFYNDDVPYTNSTFEAKSYVIMYYDSQSIHYIDTTTTPWTTLYDETNQEWYISPGVVRTTPVISLVYATPGIIARGTTTRIFEYFIVTNTNTFDTTTDTHNEIVAEVGNAIRECMLRLETPFIDSLMLGAVSPEDDSSDHKWYIHRTNTLDRQALVNKTWLSKELWVETTANPSGSAGALNVCDGSSSWKNMPLYISSSAYNKLEIKGSSFLDVSWNINGNTYIDTNPYTSNNTAYIFKGHYNGATTATTLMELRGYTKKVTFPDIVITDNDSAVTKKYVDDAISAGGGNPSQGFNGQFNISNGSGAWGTVPIAYHNGMVKPVGQSLWLTNDASNRWLCNKPYLDDELANKKYVDDSNTMIYSIKSLTSITGGMTIDGDDGNYQRYTLTGDTIINPPVNMVIGQKIELEIRQGNTGHSVSRNSSEIVPSKPNSVHLITIIKVTSTSYVFVPGIEVFQ